MKVTKRIITNKTPMGYTIQIWTKNSDVFNDLLIGIKRFFEKIELMDENEENNPQSNLDVKQEKKED